MSIVASLVRVGIVGVTVATDRDGEPGEFAVADDPAELAFGSEHAGGGPAQRHLAPTASA
jgi:hypothetical protein